MFKEFLRKKWFLILLSIIIISVFVALSVFVIQTVQIIMKENEYVDSIYKAASGKYDENEHKNFNKRIEKAISKYKKSKINSSEEINSRLLEISNKTINENHLEGAEQILEECSDKKDVIKEKQAVIYNLAKAYMKKKDYLSAYEFFESCENFSDAKKLKSDTAYKYAEAMYKDGDYEEAYIYYESSNKKGLEKKIKESKYKYIVNNVLTGIKSMLNKYLDNDDYDLVEDLGNYRYSKEIALWSEVNKKAEEYKESDVDTVESRLKWRLKNPFSYIRGNKISTAQIRKGYRKGYATLKITVGLKYYAKNSFGALIGDYHVDSVEHPIFLNGIKYKKAKKIVNMSGLELSKKAQKVK